MKKIITIFYTLIFSCVGTNAQDPHFSQFFIAPSILNPSLTGTSYYNWSASSNFRQQWSNAGTPFKTLLVSADVKLIGKNLNENVLGFSTTLVSDQSMLGSFKSNYIQSSFAYHIKIGQLHKVGLGISGNYGQRRLDYSQLSFGEQFTNGGYDINLPNGESALMNMKPFFSLSTGFLYSYQSEYLNIQAGLAGFHLNNPKQTFINDPNQIIPKRFVIHLNSEYILSNSLMLYINTAFQKQSSQQYLNIGGATGIDISNGSRQSILYTGAWLRNGDAFYPYLGLKLGTIQMGLSHDITISKQNRRAEIPRSFEISLLFKPQKSNPGIIPCPWR
jgi:type IX secretion system PorP/SprF family membrane protein